ncbi:hypothetical protein C8R44DRAFT_747725 [Mycena epipterygia]|nr:hypothetical protein C8R44DRAFT_747725 [Mycena epipterygia]
MFRSESNNQAADNQRTKRERGLRRMQGRVRSEYDVEVECEGECHDDDDGKCEGDGERGCEMVQRKFRLLAARNVGGKPDDPFSASEIPAGRSLKLSSGAINDADSEAGGHQWSKRSLKASDRQFNFNDLGNQLATQTIQGISVHSKRGIS